MSGPKRPFLLRVTLQVMKESAADVRQRPPLASLVSNALKLKVGLGNCNWGERIFLMKPDLFDELLRALATHGRYDVITTMQVESLDRFPTPVYNVTGESWGGPDQDVETGIAN